MSIYGYNFNSVSNLSQLTQAGYQATPGYGGISTSPVLPWNSHCVSMYASNVDAFLLLPPIVTAVRYVRQKVSFTLAGYANNQYPIYLCDPSGSLQVAIKTSNIAGTVYVMRGGTTVATWTGFGLVAGVATNIEVYTYIDSTAGFVNLYLNGILFNTFTGNTQNSSTYNTVGICGCYSSGTSTGYVHDIIIDDAPTDTIIGNKYVKSLKVNAVVANSGFAAVGSVTDIPTILNNVPYNSAQYIEAASSGATITLQLVPVDSTDVAISALQITERVQKSGDSDCSGQVSVTVNGTTYSGTATALPNGYVGLTVNATADLTTALVDGAVIEIARTA